MSTFTAPQGVHLLVEAVQLLSMARDMAAVQEVVRTAARRLTGADGATFVLRDGKQCHYVDEDAVGPLWKGKKFPLGACVSGWAMLNQQPAVIPDIYADDRIPHDAYRETFVKSLVMVPIRTLDPIGAIGNYWATPHAATAEEVRLLQALADATAVAVENVRLLADLEDRVRARTSDLEMLNVRLRQTNADLEAAQHQADRVFAAFSKTLVGSVLDGKYRLDEQLGSGGFGVVFRGQHLVLDHPVAVKVFRPASGNDSGRELQRFLREGATAIRLAHPNVVRVLDSGLSDDGVAYLVMELLQGRSLAQDIAARGPLKVRRAVRVAGVVAAVLAEAHAKGILHRDVKPDNVFLHNAAGREVVKVVDFGIAKFFGDADGTAVSRLTRTGSYVGTPAFVAPEIVTGGSDDGRSDVFSLGAMLYEMLAGVSPWTRQQQLEIAAGTTTALLPREFRHFRTDVPPELESVLRQSLLWDPLRRPTAAEFAAVLADLAADLSDPDDPDDGSEGDRFVPLPTGTFSADDDEEFWLSGLR
jgi:serine/threonine protein kinase